ncbi:MAG: response regulator transcription factor [Methylococcus sp.]|nr:response regulator transcription factor [Methylococcus sp.]
MKLLIVDDHAIFREGLAALLLQTGQYSTVFHAGDAVRGLELANTTPDLDVVLLDLGLPAMDGVSAIAEFGRRRPDLPVVVISASECSQDAKRALAAGASGYVAKSASPGTLLSALRLVLDGEVYLPPLLLNQADGGQASGDGLRLTSRQTEVLRLIVAGLSNKEIGRELSLSEKTVKVHITSIFKALNVVNRTQAASAARRLGLM